MNDPGRIGILVHGRGGSAADMRGLATHLDVGDYAWLTPEAPGNTWYPQRFLAPLEDNEPWLSRALATVDGEVARAGTMGVPPERVVLIGFSQGACLALEYAARHAQRWGGVIAFTGGLIGPDGTPRDYPGDFAGTPVLLGTSDPDPHVPVARARETAEVLEGMGARVDLRIYQGMGHTINGDELEAARALLAAVGSD